MADNLQNSNNPQHGKSVTRIEKFQTLSGQTVLIRWLEVSVQENGFLRKEEIFDVIPPLADGRIPDRVADIRECCVCLALYHRDNVSCCPVCGRYFCQICAEAIKISDKAMLACKECADEANANLLKKVIKYFWNLKD